MTVKEIKLGHTATFGNDEDANAAMDELRQLNPTYHWCPDWDYMAICDKDKEYDCCTCEKQINL